MTQQKPDDDSGQVDQQAQQDPEARRRELPPPPELPGFQRSYLRGQAHHLKPLVQVGQGGVTGPVLGAVDRALLDHELIKVRMIRPEDKKAMAAELAEGASACLCGLVGHMAILYRPHPDKPRISLPCRPDPVADDETDAE